MWICFCAVRRRTGLLADVRYFGAMALVGTPHSLWCRVQAERGDGLVLLDRNDRSTLAASLLVAVSQLLPESQSSGFIASRAISLYGMRPSNRRSGPAQFSLWRLDAPFLADHQHSRTRRKRAITWGS